jgi:hypothetical protein
MCEAGQLSAFGWVEAVAGNVARIRKPDGGLLFMLGDDWHVPAGPAPTATPQPTPAKIIAAEYAGPWARFN